MHVGVIAKGSRGPVFLRHSVEAQACGVYARDIAWQNACKCTQYRHYYSAIRI